MGRVIEAFRHTASVLVDAPPETVWGLVTDVERMGEWSPICRNVEWLEGDGPIAGARFRGYSRRWYGGWWRTCRITEADAPRAFAFSTEVTGVEHTRWRYELTPEGSATRLTESYEAVAMPRYVRLFNAGPHIRRANVRANARGIETTLARIKDAAERS